MRRIVEVVDWDEVYSTNAEHPPCPKCRPHVDGSPYRRGEGSQPPFHMNCACRRRHWATQVVYDDGSEVWYYADGEVVEMNGENSMEANLYSEPVGAVLQVNGRPIQDLDRRALKRQLDAGELEAIEFDAVVFRQGPNANHFRFRDRDLPSFASSYVGQPFLRDHNTHSIEARDGTLIASGLVGTEFLQTVRLTTARGMKAFLEGQIDRFSIGWYYDGVTCSVCNEDWFRCSHWPGRGYTVRDEEGNEREVLAEIIFESPRGKETSAVNAPAVPGTHILSILCEQKELAQRSRLRKEKETMGMQNAEAGMQNAEPEAPVAAHEDVWGAYMRQTVIERRFVGVEATWGRTGGGTG